MHITIEKKIHETLEVKPGCYKDYCFYSKVNNEGTLIRVSDCGLIVYKPGETGYDATVHKAMSGEEISEMEFMQKFNQLQLLFRMALNEGILV